MNKSLAIKNKLYIFFLFIFCASENTEATTINGDLIVDDNDQTTISSLTYVNGNVTVKDNGVLTIQSSTLQINQTNKYKSLSIESPG